MTARLLAIKTFSIVSVFTATLTFCFFWGPLSRRYSSQPITKKVSGNVEVFRLWETEMVSGRNLYLFDRHLNVVSGGTDVTNENYLDLALKKGIVRQIYHVVPKSAWQEVRGVLASNPAFSYKNGMFVLPMPEGRLYVMTLDKIKHEHERVLIILNSKVWCAEELKVINNLVDRNILKSDIFTIVEPPDNLPKILATESD